MPDKASAERPMAKQGGARPDVATLAGLAIAALGILGGLLLEKGQIQDVAQGTAALIVLGGTMGAVLVTTPMPIVLRAFKGLGSVFFERSGNAGEIIETLIGFASKAHP